MPTQPIFRAYVHPNHGPITPVPINVAAVHAAGETAPTGSANEACAKELARQIEQHLGKQTRASENLRAMQALLPHMDPHFGTYITGIAVRVPGTIASQGSASNDAPIIEKLREEVSALTKELNRKVEENETLNTALNNAQHATQAGNGAADQAALAWRTRAQQLTNDLAQARGKAQQLQQDLEQAQRDTGKESVRADKAEHERSVADAALGEVKDARNKLQVEVSMLRRDKAELGQKLKQLHAQLEAASATHTGATAPGAAEPALRRPPRVALPADFQQAGGDA